MRMRARPRTLSEAWMLYHRLVDEDGEDERTCPPDDEPTLPDAKPTGVALPREAATA